jgi:hypothetical protein
MESIVKLFSDSLKMKKLPSDIVFITLVKMVLNRRLFGANLSLFQTVETTFEKGTLAESPFTLFQTL